MSWELRKVWNIDGYTCAIIESDTHFCGYVGVGPAHRLYGKEYNKPIDFLNNERLDWIIDVHGGITYSGGGNYPVSYITKDWWFGFDCHHYGDNKDNCGMAFCIDECEKLVKELKKLS